MNTTIFEQAGSRQVGTVDFVSPDEIKVALDIEAPESVALNAGVPRPFPRINGYLLIPVDDGFLVGQIEWITVERSPFPKRRGMQDFGLIDLPYPLRKLRLNPLGTLRVDGQSPDSLLSVSNARSVEENKDTYTFSRGADALPSVGDAVLLPTEIQLRSIVKSSEKQQIKIGTSPLAGDAQVCIDPNRLFGRHLAVLGNTGSGKSCSVAGLIRWSLEQATNKKSSSNPPNSSNRPNARFIILDPNGEYSRALGGDEAIRPKPRIFKVNPSDGEKTLKVPLWFWNSAEWCSFTQASARTQRPLLQRALREIKSGRIDVVASTKEEKRLALRRFLSSCLILVQSALNLDTFRSDETKFGFRLKSILSDLDIKIIEYPESPLERVRMAIDRALKARRNTFPSNGKSVEYYRAFTEKEVQSIVTELNSALEALGNGVLPAVKESN